MLKSILPSNSSDDTASIQLAFDGLLPGDILEFQPGVYRVSDQVILGGAEQVKLLGRGATILSTNPARAALTIQDCVDITVTGLDLQGSGVTRLSSDRTCGLLVYRSTGVQIISNYIHGHAGAGIMLQTTSDFLIQGNLVTDTLADAIHITNRSHDGVISFNTTNRNGDDGVALVGYRKNGGRVHDVQILGNSILGNTHGRGITIEGSYNAVVDNNYIQDTSAAGIIIISSPPSTYNSYGSTDIQISRNTIVRANYSPTIVHGGILLSAQTGTALEDGVEIPLTISNVVISDNTLQDTVGSGAHIRVSPNNFGIQLLSNDFVDLDSSHGSWTVYGNSQVTKSGNTYNGLPVQ
jgi:hypothetical protein